MANIIIGPLIFYLNFLFRTMPSGPFILLLKEKGVEIYEKNFRKYLLNY